MSKLKERKSIQRTALTHVAKCGDDL